MVLVKSISGIRGTLENIPGKSLSDLDISKTILSYINFVVKKTSKKKVVIGRDARPSGDRISKLVIKILIENGIDVVDLGLATTPSIGIYVKTHSLSGGVVISASHNGIEWNALKLLNDKGEFLSKNIASKIINADTGNYKKSNQQGKYNFDKNALEEHIQKILSINIINLNAIKKKNFKVIVDGINSVGGLAVPELLKKIGVKKINKLNCIPNGKFSHNPEPLPENIIEIRNIMKNNDFDLGIVVDPDVDRLCFLDEKGNTIGEEYTLVLAAKQLLSKQEKIITCSNLSSTMALKKITNQANGKYFSSAVGEINVVEKMKESNADIGGEGNGGVIYPKTHYGRDALVGIAIILSLLAETDSSLSALKNELPQYFISKNKIFFNKDFNLLVDKFKKEYVDYNVITIDGIKIERKNSWFHIRKSNTEPVVRIYAESLSKEKARLLANEVIEKIKKI
mgnify:FL=1